MAAKGIGSGLLSKDFLKGKRGVSPQYLKVLTCQKVFDMIRPISKGVTGMKVTHQNLKKVQSIFFIPVRPAIKICRCTIDHADFPTEKFDLEGPLFEYQTPPAD